MDLVEDVAELGEGDVFEALAAIGKLLVDFDGGFLHHLVGFLRAAKEEEVVAARHARVAVVAVEPEAEHARLGSFLVRVGSFQGCCPLDCPQMAVGAATSQTQTTDKLALVSATRFA